MDDRCKICKSDLKVVFEKLILKKYTVKYHQCIDCGFIQTDKPFWLDEAYKSAITSLDIGILSRNIMNADIVSYVIKFGIIEKNIFLDYGGGYGLFVRLMRDKGFNFFRQDYFCENIFSKSFDLKDMKENVFFFDIVTAFEVFEHLESPLAEIKNIIQYSDTLVFSTELQPNKHLDNWWYTMPETGQHISFYTKKSLVKIACFFNMEFYSFSNCLHMFYKKNSRPRNLYLINFFFKYNRLLNKLKLNSFSSLLQVDYQKIKNEL